MKGYKVVRRQLDKLYSACERRWPTEYNQLSTTIPIEGCGPLTCFKTRAAARHFKNRLGFCGMEIWLCDYEEHKGMQVVWFPASPAVSLNRLYQANSTLLIPGKVVLAASIKLIRRIA